MVKRLSVLIVFLFYASLSYAQINSKQVVYTTNAPAPIGTYSQAIKLNNMVYVSGQIGLSPKTNELIGDDFDKQVRQAFENLIAICKASGNSLEDVVKLTIYVTDLSKFSTINQIMADYFKKPYPARVVVEVSKLPKGAKVEVDAILLK